MVENPGKEVKRSDGLFFRISNNFHRTLEYQGNGEWTRSYEEYNNLAIFKWTLPEPKTRKVELFEVLVEQETTGSFIDWMDERRMLFYAPTWKVTKLGPSRIVEIPSE